ncbi:mycothiol synthase [Saccharothrix tamanrassetensis]|uniref:Mycothiol synthase n=1 Tax=Saccharothrix tamanrassetensis TaxID=1051531 RepID=A0A841CKM1_9PSEU|nr:GNAT family N-acetyltransferase [Saccharothrix tamanrassetensis]MBB5957483.1 mycothiol synthase [Saccharothrix tamanrassetensis]
MSPEVVKLDPHRAGQAELAEYVRIRQANADPEDDELDFDSVVARMRNPFPGLGDAAYWLVRNENGVVGLAYLRLPEDENSHMALTEVVVDPEHRRQGIGTAVLRALLPEMRARARRVVEGWLVVQDSPGDRWAKSLGFRTVRTVVRMGLEIADADRSRWEVRTPEGYRLERWVGAVPEGLLAPYAEARSAIHDAPTGQTEFRQPDWTPERIREGEAEARGQGVEQRVVVALHGDAVVGLTEVIRLPRRPDEYYQGDTAVLAAHRGRRIGLWLKGEMARWLVADRPGLQRITTATESDNEHMIRVNREMGFHTVRSVLVLAQDISALGG